VGSSCLPIRRGERARICQPNGGAGGHAILGGWAYWGGKAIGIDELPWGTGKKSNNFLSGICQIHAGHKRLPGAELKHRASSVRPVKWGRSFIKGCRLFAPTCGPPLSGSDCPLRPVGA